MAIPASELVKIVPRVLSGTGKDLVFNGLFLTGNNATPAGQIVALYSADEVGEYYGFDSQEYLAASVYFAGYNNSLTKPTTLYFYRNGKTAAPAFVRSVALENAQDAFNGLKAISAGTLNIKINAVSVALTDVDLSSATSLSNVATILQGLIRAKNEDTGVANATVTYNGSSKNFTITNGDDGAESLIEAPTGTVADAMNFTSASVISQGQALKTYTETMADVTDLTQNFVTYSTIEEITDYDDARELASWSNTQFGAGNQFLYVYWSSDTALTTNNAGDTVVAKLRDHNYEGVTFVYNALKYSAFVMGAAASIAWDNLNSTITFAFKAQTGLEANVTTKQAETNLINNGVNFMGNYATRNDNFILFQNGQMSGQFAWIDTYLNSTWINNALQVQILAGLEASGRVPYTEAGYTLIRGWVQDVADRAIANGCIDTGVNLSQTQKNQLMVEAGGLDISSELYNSGYYLQIVDATASIRQQRTSPACNFWYTYGGSIHKINLPSTAVV